MPCWIDAETEKYTTEAPERIMILCLGCRFSLSDGGKAVVDEELLAGDKFRVITGKI